MSLKGIYLQEMIELARMQVLWSQNISRFMWEDGILRAQQAWPYDDKDAILSIGGVDAMDWAR